MTDEEIRLARSWLTEVDVEPSDIATLLRQDQPILSRLLVMDQGRVKQGRPIMLDEGVVDELLSLWDFVVANADGRCEVTVEMLRRKSRSKKECVAAGLHGFKGKARPGKQRPGLLQLQEARACEASCGR